MTAKDMPPSRSFRFNNPFRFIIEAHEAGYSQANILWILETLEMLEPMRQIIDRSDWNESDPC